MAQYHGWQDKAAFRLEMKNKREAIAEELRRKRSEAACNRLIEWAEASGMKSVMAYASFRSELSLDPFIEWCWENGIELILPRCIPEARTMTLYRLESWSQLTAGAYGIREPDPARIAALPADYLPDAVVVPGLAFDRQGGRMGYGAGYYDRFAEHAIRLAESRRQKLLWIGAGFEAQLVERVPLEAHDLRLDGVVTEQAFYSSQQADGR
ncbi:5-formyltetrahydrofolate cyclo-ligase [Paenibacillus nanensis]|uniref:5-formyltetrahydrofolate cyclo-ligase n=1 Tax=Paenibacillus nanensis TaxID=393251 RepID=A0A3A1UQL6_9BACL|nr:5-formyltetrahydrofolate cyclo-ligase [Paenibacillus nanensis]RIX50847.1 5-formyltetrahydrofolate cyclo-ligase [Paenibacillus nanensis]